MKTLIYITAFAWLIYGTLILPLETGVVVTPQDAILTAIFLVLVLISEREDKNR